MENDLTERYNDGLVPPPELANEPDRLPFPAWRPSPSQVKAARKSLARDLALLALLFAACLLIAALALGGIS